MKPRGVDLKVSIELTVIDTLCLIRACYCRRDEIDAKVTDLLAEAQLKDNDPAVMEAIIVLDGERYILEVVLNKLWTAARPKKSV